MKGAPPTTPDCKLDVTGAPVIRSSALVRHTEACFVYTVELPHGVKVGMTENPVARLKSFRTAAPTARFLQVWWFKDRQTAAMVEAYLHQLLSPFHVCGEIFDLDEGLVDILQRASQAALEAIAELRQMPNAELRGGGGDAPASRETLPPSSPAPGCPLPTRDSK